MMDDWIDGNPNSNNPIIHLPHQPMNNILSSLTTDFKVRSYEINPDGCVSLLEICNYLQESAGNHARMLGVAVDQLLEKDMTWVLSRMHVKVAEFPKWGETVCVKTWPAEVNRLFAIRDFELCDMQGRQIGAATTAWILVNIAKKRPMRLPQDIREFHPEKPVRALNDDFPKLPIVESPDHETDFSVRFADLDLNRHANNAAYVKWVLESAPAEILENHRVTELEIEYKNESVFGEKIRSTSALFSSDEPSSTYVHQVFAEEKNIELTRAKTNWKSIE